MIRNYLSLIKFSHTIFAMPFALIGFFLAVRQTDLFANYFKTNASGENLVILSREQLGIKFLLVILCMVFARSAAMAFNRYLDRHFDARNPRTAVREVPAGIISANAALIFTIASSVLFVVTALFINELCFYLSPVALAVILGYSYTKRFTALCHLILGLGLSLAPIGAYLAVTARFDLLPLLFSFTVITWVSGFDIIYALQDEAFDRSQNLYSIPAILGKTKALRISELLHLASAMLVLAAGLYGNFGWIFWIGFAIFSGMLFYQHTLVKPNDLRRVNLAFMTSNGIASVVFAVLVITDIFV